MKLIFKSIICLVLVLMSYTARSSTKISCPPVNTIAETKFKYAARLDGAWILISDFYHENKLWRVMFDFGVKGDENSKVALKRGQEFFNTKVNLSYPKIDLESGKFVCIYADDDKYHVSSEVAFD